MAFATIHWLFFAGVNLLSLGTNAASLVVIMKRIKIDFGYKLLIWLDIFNSLAMSCVAVIMSLLYLVWYDNDLLTQVACGSLWLSSITPITCGILLTTLTAAFR